MQNFERYKDSKDSLSVGISTWIEKQIQYILRVNSTDEKAPVRIKGIEVTKSRNLKIYFVSPISIYNYSILDSYFSKIFHDFNCSHIFEMGSSLYRIDSSAGLYESGEYIVKYIYKHAFIPENKYRLES
jgi:hypothetical protein